MAKTYRHLGDDWVLEREEGWKEGDPQTYIPKVLENSDYARIMQKVEAGELTIEEAE